VPPIPSVGINSWLKNKKHKDVKPSTTYKYRTGDGTNQELAIADTPPAVKVSIAKIGCQGVIFPGNRPTPTIPMPRKKNGRLIHRLRMEGRRRNIAIKMSIPEVNIVRLKMVDEG